MKRFGLIVAGLALLASACRFNLKPSYPAAKVAESLRKMCSQDYHLSVEARHTDKTLQMVVWKVGLFNNKNYDLQGMRKEAEDAMQHVFLCATRIALSTDAPLDFIELKMADVLTGATITLWRYVPDIRDSMYQRIGDTEYYNRLVIEIDVHKEAPSQHMAWSRPLSLSEFLAKQVILRARRDGGQDIQAHADLSEPSMLGLVIDNWTSIEEEGPEQAAKVTDSVHKSAQTVLKGYHFKGFRGITLRDSEGAALGSWTL